MTVKSEKVGIVGHFQEKVGKSRSNSKKVGKSRKNRAHLKACNLVLVFLFVCFVFCLFVTLWGVGGGGGGVWFYIPVNSYSHGL